MICHEILSRLYLWNMTVQITECKKLFQSEIISEEKLYAYELGYV